MLDRCWYAHDFPRDLTLKINTLSTKYQTWRQRIHLEVSYPAKRWGLGKEESQKGGDAERHTLSLAVAGQNHGILQVEWWHCKLLPGSPQADRQHLEDRRPDWKPSRLCVGHGEHDDNSGRLYSRKAGSGWMTSTAVTFPEATPLVLQKQSRHRLCI